MSAISRITTTPNDDSRTSTTSKYRYRTAAVTPTQIRVANNYHLVCLSFQRFLVQLLGPPPNTLFADVEGWKIILVNTAHHPKDFGDGVIHTKVPFTYSYQTYNGRHFWKLKIRVEPGFKVIDLTGYDEPLGYQFISTIMKVDHPAEPTWAEAAHDVLEGVNVVFGSFERADQQDKVFVEMAEEEEEEEVADGEECHDAQESSHTVVEPFSPMES